LANSSNTKKLKNYNLSQIRKIKNWVKQKILQN